MKIPCCEITIQGNKNLMSVELAHQKADKHLCVALHRKVRIRGYTLLSDLFAETNDVCLIDKVERRSYRLASATQTLVKGIGYVFLQFLY